MYSKNLIIILGGIGFALSSCAGTGGGGMNGENYDVSNPYDAPDYADASSSSSQASNDVNPAYDAPAAYEEPASSPVVQSSPSPSISGDRMHTVGRGDTLWGIGKKYGVSIDSIKAANGLTSDVAVLGAKLRIPGS